MGKTNDNNKKTPKKDNITNKKTIKKKLTSSVRSTYSPLNFLAEIIENKDDYQLSWKKYLETKKELGENFIVGIPYFE